MWCIYSLNMRFILVLIGFFITLTGSAQDTLRLSMRQADSLFLRTNVLLLAERFRIEAAQAEVIQASLLANPTISFELSAFNSASRTKVLDVGRQGQKIVSAEQLLFTAGKRNKRIALAQEAARLTEFEFTDLLRGLRFELRSQFYDTYFQRQTINRYNQQIQTIQQTVDAFEKQYERNNVSLRELLRLKALLFQLRNDRTDILFQLAENQKSLRTLLGTEFPVVPIVNEAGLLGYSINGLSADSLRDTALRQRSDLKAMQSLTKQAELNYNLQKALARPDVKLAGTYDQAGSYIPHYVGVGLAIDLPVFNKNQGAIKSARSQISYQQQYEKQKQLQIANEVSTAYDKVVTVERMVQSVEGRFTDQFEQLNQGIMTNFGKGNISLLEFVDLIETYNESIRELNRLKADRIGAYEALTYAVGQDLFSR